jgi:nitroreductase
MMLAAWSEGIGSCPNGVSDPNRMREVVGHAPDEQVATVLSFGYPARSWNPDARPAEEWIFRANRRPFDEIVERR